MVNSVNIIALHFPHKTASTFAFKVLRSMEERFGHKLFSQNVTPDRNLPNHADLVEEVTQRAQNRQPSIFLRGPVRNFTYTTEAPQHPSDYRYVTPELLLKDSDYFAICQTRDPLDLVVSQYFSHGWIHPPAEYFASVRARLQAGEISVYDYALMEFDGKANFGQDSILKKIRDFTELKARLGNEKVLMLTYEEMVTDYSSWSQKFVAFLSGKPELGMSEDELTSTFEAIEPKYEAPEDNRRFYDDPLEYVRENKKEMRHVRSPWPGDHRRFLSQRQILNLREIVSQSQLTFST